MEQLDIAHHRQESQQGEDDEVFGGLGLRLLALLVLLPAKNKGLVGIAEGLGDEGHEHGNLHAGAIDAELHAALVARQQLWQQYLVGHLIEDAHDAEEQQWPGIVEHALEQLKIEKREAKVLELFEEAKGDDGGAEEVDAEDVAHLVGLAVPAHPAQVAPMRRYKEDEERQHDRQEDETNLEAKELPRLALLSQAGKEDGLEGVQRHYNGHHLYVFRVVGIAHCRADRANKQHHQGHKQRRHRAYGRQCGAEHLSLVHALAVGVVEEGRLHAEGEYHQQQCGVGIDVGYYAVATRGGAHVISVDGDQQVVQEPAHDAAQAVDDRVRE